MPFAGLPECPVSLSLRGSRLAVANAADENSGGVRNRRPYEGHEPTSLASVRMESRRSATGRCLSLHLRMNALRRAVMSSGVAAQIMSV